MFLVSCKAQGDTLDLCSLELVELVGFLEGGSSTVAVCKIVNCSMAEFVGLIVVTLLCLLSFKLVLVCMEVPW